MTTLFYPALKRCLFSFVLIISLKAGAQQKDTLLPLSETIKNYYLGSTIIPVHILMYGAVDSFVFINLHDDETTSVAAAQSILKKTGGVLIRISNNNSRRVSFELRGQRYDFDPNRIFSDARRNTVKGPSQYFSEAVNKVKDFSDFLLKQIPGFAKTLIALHNNKPDLLNNNKIDSGLHIYSYIWPRQYYREAVEVHINTLHDPDDFFFTTDSVLLKQLAYLQYNVVLQHPKAEDDGSLSIYYSKIQKSYINVEAEHYHFNIQHEMIAALCRVLKEGNGSSTVD